MAHDQEVVGENPGTVYWMGVTNASYYTNIHEIYKKRKPNGAHIKKVAFLFKVLKEEG